jgi:metal-sulfur cluster biosynthetic enzyme
VAKYPARVKCALLAWMAFKDAAARAWLRRGAGMTKRRAKRSASDRRRREAMKDVVDPELGINVVDLGLIYGMHVDADNVATIDMTLTSAACPLTDVIEEQAARALMERSRRRPGERLPDQLGVDAAVGPDKITDEGREQLRALGFNV